MTSRPAPRPALRKAPDSDVHPAAPKTGVVPLHGNTGDSQGRTPEAPGDTAPAPAPRRSVRAALNPRRRAAEPEPASRSTGATAPPAPTPARTESRDLRKRRGSATSDALRGSSGDKLVDCGLRIPKSLRKRMRQEAKRRGISPDELLVLLLRDHLGD